MSRASNKVVRVATISTTNITGLRAILRGSSLIKAWPMAGIRIDLSAKLDFASLAAADLLMTASEELPGLHRQMFDDGPQRQRGEESEPAHDQDDASQKTDK